MKHILKARLASGLNELASVSDGIAVAFGLTEGRATPAVVAGIVGIALRIASRFLPGDSDRSQA